MPGSKNQNTNAQPQKESENTLSSQNEPLKVTQSQDENNPESQRQSEKRNNSQRETVEVTLLQINSTVKFRMWASRKPWKDKAASLHFIDYKGKASKLDPKDFYQLEKDTSALMKNQEECTVINLKTPFEFSTVVKAEMFDTEALLKVWMYPGPNAKEFKNFWTYFKGYFVRLIEKCL